MKRPSEVLLFVMVTILYVPLGVIFALTKKYK